MKWNFERLHYDGWLYWIFFLVSPVAALVLNIWIQLPGYAVAFMAVAAFVATFRDKIPKLQKLVWCVAVCGLFVAEIRAIRRDKEEQAGIEKARRDIENKQFADNVDKFDKALNALSTLKVEGELQEMWNNEIAAQEIEKNQFVYAMAQSSGPADRLVGKNWPLEVFNSGSVPLNEVSVVIMGWDSAQKRYFSIPTLRSKALGPFVSKERVQSSVYLIAFKTRHSEFQEDLYILPDKEHPGAFVQTLSVSRDFDNKELWQCCPPKDCLNLRCVSISPVEQPH